jgi:two-component system, NarL family, sensor histidine kinase DegS
MIVRIPLKVGETLIGFWLLGRRDPNDLYPLVEIPILQSLANQTAVALSNILQTEQLRRIFESNIDRNETERMNLALELHDSILNGLAELHANLDENSLSTKFQASYDDLTSRLREIVSDLRPPMLMYGLKPAIEGLAENLMERNGDRTKIYVDIQSTEERVPENIERHLYRIVQEGCENALRHSRAERIGIFGTLTPQKIDLIIEDDGAGFDKPIEVHNLVSGSHFGLAGMVERARLINAEINFQSTTDAGVKIYLSWANGTEKGLKR